MPPIANCAVKIFAAGPIDEVPSPHTLLSCSLKSSNFTCPLTSHSATQVLKRSLSTIGRRRVFSAVGFVGSSLALLLALPLSRFGLWGPTAAFSVANAMIALHPSVWALRLHLYCRKWWFRSPDTSYALLLHRCFRRWCFLTPCMRASSLRGSKPTIWTSQ